MNKFDSIQALLGLTDKEKAQVLSINMANNPNRKYKESMWFRCVQKQYILCNLQWIAELLYDRFEKCVTFCFKRQSFSSTTTP
jgi:hypothetical protein